MTQYVDKSLATDEEILMRGRWPLFYWIGAWLQLILLGIVVIGIFLFIAAVVRMRTTEFAVTDKRVILKRGWIKRTTEELAVESIEGVHLDQSFWGRIFRYGKIVVTGTGEAQIHFPPMPEPIAFRRAIEDARSLGREMHLAGEEKEALVAVAEAAQHTAKDDRAHAPPRRRASFVGLFGR